MSRRKKKVIAIITTVAILLVALCASGVALDVANSLFKNNTPTYITLESPVNGIIRKSDDYEAYVFEIEKDGALSICLEHEDFMDSTKSGWVVTLYKIDKGDDYKEVAYYESFWNDMTSSWPEVGLGAGTYCIVVKAGLYFLENEYTLTTSFTETSSFEKEFNDTKETANPVEVSYGKYASSNNRSTGTDVDWYTFEIYEDSCVNVSFVHPDETFPQVGWVITLTNEKNEKITQFTSRLTELDIKTGALGLKAGRYYLCVESQTELCQEYTVLVGSDKAVNSEFEMNDSPETSIPIPMNIKMTGCLADRLLGLDKDYYKFEVEADGYIDVEFTHDNQNEDKNGWNIRVLKAMDDGTYYEVVRKVSKWNQEKLRIESLGLSKGEYYLLVDGDSVSYNSATYTLSWSFTQADNFEQEPNGDAGTAKPIEAGTFYHGAIISSDVSYDEDYYKFELATKTNVSIDFRHEAGDKDDVCWYLSILNDRNEEMVFTDIKLSSEISTTGVVTLPAGTYYVKVETGMYGSEIPYYFRLKR